MEQAKELVGNTQISRDEFRATIKDKSVAQLHNKIRLGAFLQTRLKADEADDPRMEAAVASLQEQIELLQQELDSRQDELNQLQQGVKKEIPTGPLDQVIGVKSLSLSGKADMGQ